MLGYRGFLCHLFGTTSLALIQQSLQDKQAKYEGKNQLHTKAILLQLDMSHMRVR